MRNKNIAFYYFNKNLFFFTENWTPNSKWKLKNFLILVYLPTCDSHFFFSSVPAFSLILQVFVPSMHHREATQLSARGGGVYVSWTPSEAKSSGCDKERLKRKKEKKKIPQHKVIHFLCSAAWTLSKQPRFLPKRERLLVCMSLWRFQSALLGSCHHQR